MSSIEFPRMRADVVDALRALANREYQMREWGAYRREENRYDDLTLNINLLYDDCRVLPDPSSQIGSILFPGEIQSLRKLNLVLAPLINELGNRPDMDYLSDPRWNDVIEAASAALAVLEKSGPAKVS